jgi:hypothetical protein
MFIMIHIQKIFPNYDLKINYLVKIKVSYKANILLFIQYRLHSLEFSLIY